MSSLPGLGQCFVDQCLDLSVIADVGERKERLSAVGLNLIRQLLALFGQNVSNEDGHAVAGQCMDDGPPDALCAAGHDGRLAGQVLCVWIFCH